VALFTRSRPAVRVAPLQGHEELALVDEDDVEGLLDELAMATFDHVEIGGLPEETSEALQDGIFALYDLESAPEETFTVARRAARIGYMARVAEWERVPVARKQVGSMLAGLRQAVESSMAEELGEAGTNFYDALREVTAFYVRREPLDVTYDAEEGFKPMWTIPGMGGEFRALLRDRTLAMAFGYEEEEEEEEEDGVVDVDPDLEYLWWVWKYGFLLRAFEEFFREQ
jgi:hypothetical protein